MCTIQPSSAREAVTKICTLPLLAGENVGSRRFMLVGDEDSDQECHPDVGAPAHCGWRLGVHAGPLGSAVWSLHGDGITERKAEGWDLWYLGGRADLAQ